jgi:hypothetical protein
MTQTPTEPKHGDKKEQSATEEQPSRLKRAFQWSAAILAPFAIETPQRAFRSGRAGVGLHKGADRLYRSSPAQNLR